MSYALEDPEGRGKTVRRMLAERAEEEFAISPLVVLECLAGAIRAGDGRGGALHEQYLSTSAMLPISPEVGAKAAELRAGFALKTPDALHLATALTSGCNALWTNDRRLARAAGDFAVAIV